MSAISIACRRAVVTSKVPAVARCLLRPLSLLSSTVITTESKQQQASHHFLDRCNSSQRLFSAAIDESSPFNGASSSVFDRNPDASNSHDVEKTSSDLLSPALPPLTSEEYNPKFISEQIHKMAGYNQGRKIGQAHSNIKNRKRFERKWDFESVRLALDDYERHLQYVLDHLQRGSSNHSTDAKDLFANIHPSKDKCFETHRLLSSSTVSKAARALTRSRMDTPLLSRRIRDMERLVGKIGWTPITEELSYRLLEANGKAGNVRRTLALLELRRSRGYPPREQENGKYKGANLHISPGEKEFLHAITSIQSAQLPLRRSRNIYLHESTFSESALDNPTRYLDAILINMSKRGVSLRPEMAARMLDCYASTGRTGRAIHYFYKVRRDPVEDDGTYIPGPHPTHLGKDGLEDWKTSKRGEGVARALTTNTSENTSKGLDDDASKEGELGLNVLDEDEDEKQSGMPTQSNRRTKIRMAMQPLPPFHKIPSSVKGVPLIRNRYQPIPNEGPSKATGTRSDEIQNKTMTKYEWELDRDWSLALTAAFAFADSLTHGACGHDPIELDVVGWNILIKACCRRGAIHRALKILNETMPQKGIEPDTYSYNTVLAALARVGDTRYLQEYLIGMTNKGIRVDKYTAQAMVDGFLNVGDIQGATSLVQDIFNQHDTLPPYTSHLKIIEFALANGLIFEAKRHVYFIQQLWKWQPSQHHNQAFCQLMEETKSNPKLSKEALLKLFHYFGEDLSEQDFF
eukprot:scaffold1185_cov143-Skeletonema_menzelii.AAC.14